MTPLTCDEVNDLAGVYALGLLDADERAAIEEHLAEHWHEEYASARAAVLALASAAPEASPSPELRARILDSARMDKRPRSRRRITMMAVGVACAAAVFAVLGFSGVLRGSSDPPQQLNVRNLGNDAFFELAVEKASSRASLRLGGLPARPGAEVYQVWLIQEGQPPKSLCVIGADRDGPWTRPVEVRLKHGDAVFVTAEPDGSRTAPTQAPIVGGQY